MSILVAFVNLPTAVPDLLSLILYAVVLYRVAQARHRTEHRNWRCGRGSAAGCWAGSRSPIDVSAQALPVCS